MTQGFDIYKFLNDTIKAGEAARKIKEEFLSGGLSKEDIEKGSELECLFRLSFKS